VLRAPSASASWVALGPRVDWNQSFHGALIFTLHKCVSPYPMEQRPWETKPRNYQLVITVFTTARCWTLTRAT
jgi:hypothetical protein